MSKYDITVTASTKAADFTKTERVELRPNMTKLVALQLPNTFKGKVARWLGLPSFVQVEIAHAKRGRPAK